MITNKSIKIKKIKKEDKFDYKLLVDTTILLGEIMLKNGAETNRVEDAMHKLLRTTKKINVKKSGVRDEHTLTVKLINNENDR